MLIYLASYPRSGNTFVANVIAHYFRLPTSSAYTGEGRDHGEVLLRADGSIEQVFAENKDGESDRTARVLRDGVGAFLTDDLRQSLALDEEAFFLKTHEPPFGSYFEGERVVHIIRHPGATCWSYWHYLARKTGSAPRALEEVIEGRAFPGSWSRHALLWLQAATGLGERYLSLRFEELLADEKPSVISLSRLTGLVPRRESGVFPKFDYWHGVAPEFYRSGKASEWEQHFTPTHNALLWALHGRAMAQLGYSLAVPAQVSGITQDQYLPGLAGGERPHQDVLEFLEGLRESIQRLEGEVLNPSQASSVTDDMSSLPRRGMESIPAAIHLLQTEVANKQKGIDWLQQELAGKQKGIEWLQGELASNQAGVAWLELELADEREIVRRLRASLEAPGGPEPRSGSSGRLRTIMSRLRFGGFPTARPTTTPLGRVPRANEEPGVHPASSSAASEAMGLSPEGPNEDYSDNE